MGTSTATEATSISLYYRNGGSDKEYHVYLEEAPSGDGYLVNFAFVL